MPDTVVVHCKKHEYDVYIGRPGPWGNPFIEGKDGTRKHVIEKFRIWFLTSKDERAIWMRSNIRTLSGKRLGCWCSPLPCHGNILAFYADYDKNKYF